MRTPTFELELLRLLLDDQLANGERVRRWLAQAEDRYRERARQHLRLELYADYGLDVDLAPLPQATLELLVAAIDNAGQRLGQVVGMDNPPLDRLYAADPHERAQAVRDWLLATGQVELRRCPRCGTRISAPDEEGYGAGWCGNGDCPLAVMGIPLLTGGDAWEVVPAWTTVTVKAGVRELFYDLDLSGQVGWLVDIQRYEAPLFYRVRTCHTPLLYGIEEWRIPVDGLALHRLDGAQPGRRSAGVGAARALLP